MRQHRVLAALAVLAAIPAVALAAPLPASPQAILSMPPEAAAAPTVSAPANPPSLEAFLASLKDPAPGPAALRTSGCGPNYCTQAQRDACNQQCLLHHHGPFVGLECCSNCTTLCICGSVPTDC